MITKPNPYHAPTTAQALVDTDVAAPPRSSFANRVRFAVWLLAYLYPAWLLASFYAAWLVAWVQLGHPPRPMLDDPKSIGVATDIAYYVSGMFVMLLPALTPIGLAASFLCPIPIRRELRGELGAAFAMLYIVFCAIVLLTLRSDPGRVIEWWFD